MNSIEQFLVNKDGYSSDVEEAISDRKLNNSKQKHHKITESLEATKKQNLE